MAKEDAAMLDEQLAPISTAVGDYLKAIWQVAGSEPAATGDIARELGVTAPSVTGMLGKLAAMELIRYQPYRGAELTDAGRAEALRLIRRHRLLETFLIRDLGFGWDEVHQEAERMEHAMSERFTERLAQHLGQPTFDPHGDPIPRRDGSLPDGPDTPLVDAADGDRFEVHRVLSQDSLVLAYLAGLDIEPGRILRVVAREPLGNLLMLRSGERHVSLSKELATMILGSVKR